MDRTAERLDLVRHLAAHGVSDPRVLAALAQVPREKFVPAASARHAYEDRPLALAEGQTISQPWIVGYMAQAVAARPTDRLLEVGTGSGYGAAILSRLCAEVHTIERLPALAQSARARLDALGYDNVHVHVGDGTLGYADAAPYDGIVVTAGGPRIPPTLVTQLAVFGRLIIPIGTTSDVQRLVRLTRALDGAPVREDLGAVQFVPLIGAQAWSERP